MSTDLNIPFQVRMAAHRFRGKRADYYRYAASILKSSGGGIKILQLFENDIVRFEGRPRGILCAYWHERYSINGGNLADTFQGTLPDDEVAIIRVSQDAGGEALIMALDDVSRMAKLTDQIRIQSLATVFAGLMGLTIATLMLTLFPIFSVKELANAYDFLPLEAWGSKGKRYHAYATWVEAHLLHFVFLLAVVSSTVHWTFGNLVGPFREWLDEHFALYRVARDLKGALFLSTMSTLTKKRGGIMFTLKQSLEIFSESARTRWLKWRIDQVIDGADQTGAIGVGAFNTGMISREMFFYLEDMQKARGFSEGFEETGKYVEANLLNDILNRMKFYRWGMLIFSLVVAISIFVWQFQVIHEMRGAMSSFLATG